jgi:histidinol-phosphate/aromatic aminotransferase/cobyric acid decarboxylase-like protein
LVEFDTEDQVNAINEALLKQGIAIRPLKAFGFPHCLCISPGLPEENTALFSAIKSLPA